MFRELSLRKLGLTAAVLIIVLAGSALAGDLCRIVISSDADARLLTESGVKPLMYVQGGVLVLTSRSQTTTLTTAGLIVEPLATGITRAALAVDVRHDRGEDLPYPVVFEEGGIRLLRVDPIRLAAEPVNPGLAPVLTINAPIRYTAPSPARTPARGAMLDLETLISEIEPDSVYSYIDALQSFQTRFIGTDSNFASRNWLMNKLTEFGYDSVYCDTFTAVSIWGDGLPTVCYNVIAIKQGTLYSDDQIVFGAHRDSHPLESPGADDDASGSAGVLEIARVLADKDTDLSMAFVLFDAEEPGLYGSWYYATQATIRGDHIAHMFNLDVIGYYEGEDFAWLAAGPAMDYGNLLADLADSLSGISLSFAVMSGACWDAYAFQAYGFNAMTVAENTMNPHMHGPSDSLVYIDVDYASRITRAVLATSHVIDKTYAPTPRLLFGVPTGVPEMTYPMAETNFEVTIEPYGGATVLSGTEKMVYTIEDEAPAEVPLISLGGNLYEAVLPPVPCFRQVEFEIHADMVSGGATQYPPAGEPFMAIAATGSEISFEDDFNTHTGWGATGDATDGHWERAVPASNWWTNAVPVDYDGSSFCFVTGNEVSSDVDQGFTHLWCPLLDLSADGRYLIEYAHWFCNSASTFPYADLFEVFVSNANGSYPVKAATYGPVEMADGGWFADRFWLNDYVDPTALVRCRFTVSDTGQISSVEAGLDAFRVTRFYAPAGPVIATTDLPDWTVGVPYSGQLHATGQGELTWMDLDDALVGTGLGLGSDGLITGTPVIDGTVPLNACVIDPLGQTDEAMLTFELNAAVAVESDSMPDGVTGEAYGVQLLASGGTGTRIWTETGGNLTAFGLSLSADGFVSGTASDSGDVALSIRVEDPLGSFAEQSFSFYIEFPWICGNIDGIGTGGDAVNVSDLTYLVAYLFTGGPPPPIIEAANVNGGIDQDGSINVSDLTYLVAYLFTNGPLPNCITEG